MGDEAIRAGSALRERRRVLLYCAPVTLLFTFADVAALQRFSPLAFGVRVVWASLIVAAALALGRVSPAAENRITLAIAVASSGFFGLLAGLTGGNQSPLFHWILAMPLVIAVVLQEFPRATLGAAIATIAAGLVILVRAGQSPAACVQWAVLATGMSSLAVYASITYRRLRFREQALRETAAIASERARSYEEEVRMRDEFLGIAGHELRTPLTALVINAERLLRRPAPEEPGAQRPPQTQQTIESIHRQVTNLASLVENLLDVSRLQGGDAPASELSPTDLVPLVEAVVQRYQTAAQQHGSALELERAGPVIAAVDRGRFDRMLTNIVSNAIKFGGGQPITVTIRAAEGRARVSVRDRGAGIAPGDHERIFQRWERVAADQASGGGGRGRGGASPPIKRAAASASACGSRAASPKRCAATSASPARPGKVPPSPSIFRSRARQPFGGSHRPCRPADPAQCARLSAAAWSVVVATGGQSTGATAASLSMPSAASTFSMFFSVCSTFRSLRPRNTLNATISTATAASARMPYSDRRAHAMT
jgi:signal transduction histidine kinase